MGKLNIFEISLGSAGGVVYSGQMMQGHVTVELTEAMSMRGIILNFEGKAYVHWSTGGKNKRHYRATEKYFDQDVLLFGIWPSQGSDTVELPSGRHTFPFQFQLPEGLPSSFEGGVGHVRYQVKCKIDKPWKFDHNTKRPFTVISILDLNQNASTYCRRLQGTKRKHLCCLCCKSGPIEASFHVDRQAYVPGEAVKLFAEISNGTSRAMDKSYVDLKMVTTFHAKHKSKTTKTEVARVERPAIAGFREDSWSGENLVIPPLPPSFLVGCNIIDIHYILQLNVDPSGPALDLEVPLEIIIGTIPLQHIIEQFPPMSPSAYMECVTGKVDTREDGDSQYLRGDLSFAPMYTYYNWGHSPAAIPQHTLRGKQSDEQTGLLQESGDNKK